MHFYWKFLLLFVRMYVYKEEKDKVVLCFAVLEGHTIFHMHAQKNTV